MPLPTTVHFRPRAPREVLVALSVACAGPLAGCSPDPLDYAADASSLAPQRAAVDEPLQPLQPGPAVDPARARIGEALFSDPSLSGDGTVACVTCHPLDRAGADGLTHSRGVAGHETALNTPTIFNLPFLFRYNWSGAYTTLEEEFDAPVTKTFVTTWPEIERKVREKPELTLEFAAAYPPGGVSIANIKDALASYLETLITPGSRFDAFLLGDPDALSVAERRGYALFKDLGCSSCHQGTAVGGGSFQRFGVMQDYFEGRTGPEPLGASLGRFNTTGLASDRYVFRVASLRNVAETAPYFHDGSAATLEDAVSTMGRVQLGEELSNDQVGLLVDFLDSLTGTFHGSPL